MSLRILFTIGVPDFTGASKMAYHYARAFVAAGHEVFAICGPRPEGGGCVIEPLLAAGIHVEQEQGFAKLLDRALIRRMANFIARENIEVVVSAQQIDLKIAAWAAKTAGRPCVGFIQNRTAFSGPWPIRTLKRWGYRFTIARGVSQLICISEAVGDQHCQEFGFPRNQVAVLENGIELTHQPLASDEQRTSLRSALGLAETDVVLLNVGRLDPQKGQQVLLEAFAAADFGTRSAKLVLVGDVTAGNETAAASYAQGLQQFVAMEGLSHQVVFAGWRDDVAQLLQIADVYVHSALWEGNSLPLALLEAMAARLPVIGTDCAGHPSGFEQSVHGYIVPKGEARPLAEAMQRIVQLSEHERQTMGQAARHMVESRFDIAVAGRRFVNVVVQAASATPAMNPVPQTVPLA